MTGSFFFFNLCEHISLVESSLQKFYSIVSGPPVCLSADCKRQTMSQCHNEKSIDLDDMLKETEEPLRSMQATL